MKNKKQNKKDRSETETKNHELTSQSRIGLPFKNIPEGTLIIGHFGAGKSSSSSESYLNTALKNGFALVSTTLKNSQLRKMKNLFKNEKSD